MKRNFLIASVISAALLTTQCDLLVQDNSDEEQEQLLLGLVSGIALEAGQDLALNGTWNVFGGGTTTLFSTDTIQGKGASGAWIQDAACLQRYVIVYIDNVQGIAITQNPTTGGSFNDGGTGGSCGAFSDTSKGTFNKVVFFQGTYNDQSVFWVCTVAFAQSSQSEALAAEDTSNRSDPTAANSCGFSTWSRYERVGS
jgi:hypothetical protein